MLSLPRKKKEIKLAYLCHSWENPSSDARKVKKYMERALSEGYMPVFTPFMWSRLQLHTTLISDMNKRFIGLIKTFIICGDKWTEQMKVEMDMANVFKRNMIYYLTSKKIEKIEDHESELVKKMKNESE